MNNIRKEVMEFAEAMEKELRRHDKKKGESWKKLSLFEIEKRILRTSYTACNEGQDIDIANYCMMHYALCIK